LCHRPAYGDRAFKKLVDGVIVGLFRSGEIDKIYQRWFLSPVPPDGLNVILPMSEALQRAIRFPTDTPNPSPTVELELG
jgi:glutamate/aspartate transport system substrate-binding protein